jgi:acetyltransferase-like isoleucine patch superfamily enzyme
MLNKLLKILYVLISLPFNKINYYKRRYYNFFVINLKFFFEKRIIYYTPIAFNQKIFLTGSGYIKIGKNCSFGYKFGGFSYKSSIEIQPRYKDSIIKIGNNVSTNNNIFICAANCIVIGDNTLIGQNVCIMDHEAHGIEPNKRKTIGIVGEVIIGENVWIGNNVTILKNSKIGKNTIIATGAVVTGSFPENVIIGGVPAKIIKQI